MTTTLAPIGRELDDSELEVFNGSEGCTVYIILDGNTGQILGVVAVGDCNVVHKTT
ncbi:hypothetical protein OK351_07050 [Glutamicibacter sp. MNS18]|uniref:hypothetical protein n=1 Tax=Glutamicibacter sp. MNS18 TaxID=2989817 RepID=UPI002235C35C|nr:hypothetical protein [Glutamicibacter sp. MNS18]MCW4465258.1 hypothetical protein [Glutamicibacter sp. MNS18]